MNTEEQMAIIENWTCRFKVINGPEGRKYATMTFSAPYGDEEYIGPYKNYDTVINEAYDEVCLIVWGVVVAGGR